MGRHQNATSRRGVAGWLVATAVVVVLAVIASVVYLIAVNRRSTAADCTGSTVLNVAASTEVAAVVQAAAAAFDATKPIARSACVSTVVHADSGAVIAAALAGRWTGQSSPAPGVWVSGSDADVAAVDATASDLVAGRSKTPLATSPVVLAARTADPAASAGVSWQTLADPATGARAVLALPDPAVNPASAAAVQSVAAGAAAGPLTAAAVSAAGPSLTRLRAAAVADPPPTTGAALSVLRAGSADFALVPTTEAALTRSDLTGSAGLTAVYPTDATPSVSVLPVALAGAWMDETARAAAAAFVGYLSGSAGRQLLADQGFRVPAVRAAQPLPGITINHPIVVRPDADPATRAALIAAYALAATSPTTGPTTGPSTGPSTDVAPSGSPAASTPAPPPASNDPPTSVAPTRPPTLPPPTAPTSPTAPRPSVVTPSVAPSTAKPPASSPPVSAGPVIALVVDTSSTMADAAAGFTRLAAVKNAVASALAAAPGASVGLWTVSTADGPAGFTQRVPVGPVDSGGRPAVIATALSDVPAGTCWLYGAMQSAYPSAAATAIAGRPNRVIVITASPDSTPNLPRSKLIAGLAAVPGAVELDIVGLSGSAVNGTALTQVAAAGHGRYLAADPAGLTAVLTPLFLG